MDVFYCAYHLKLRDFLEGPDLVLWIQIQGCLSEEAFMYPFGWGWRMRELTCALTHFGHAEFGCGRMMSLIKNTIEPKERTTTCRHPCRTPATPHFSKPRVHKCKPICEMAYRLSESNNTHRCRLSLLQAIHKKYQMQPLHCLSLVMLSVVK